MRKSRFTDEQIAAALKEREAGASNSELCRRLGISQETLYRWKRKYGGSAALLLRGPGERVYTV